MCGLAYVANCCIGRFLSGSQVILYIYLHRTSVGSLGAINRKEANEPMSLQSNWLLDYTQSDEFARGISQSDDTDGPCMTLDPEALYTARD